MSCQTSTCASHAGPAPMPIVGMCSVLGDLRRDVGRHHLEHDGERTGVLQRLRVLEQPVRRLVAASLHAVAAERVDRLRGEADVRHHRDAGRDEHLDLRRDALAALELDRLARRPPS